MCPSSAVSEGLVVADGDFEKLVQQFAEREKRTQAESGVNWGEIRDRWTHQVHELFDHIESWFRPLIDSGSVEVTRQPQMLTEEALGTYAIQCLQLQIASRSLVLEPVGTLLLGAFGRIDAAGPNGTVALLLLSTDDMSPPEDRWRHVSWFISYPTPRFIAWPKTVAGPLLSRAPRPDLRPLTQESFQELFADLFGIRR